MKLKIKNDFKINVLSEQGFKSTLKEGIFEIEMNNYEAEKMTFGKFKNLSNKSEDSSGSEFSFKPWKDEKVKAGIESYWTELADRCKNPTVWENKPILYAAGISGSFFPKTVVGFNPNNIDKDYSLIHTIGEDNFIEGIQTPMLYIGQDKSTFGMHAEDWYYSGMSYNHYGAPKIWYVVERKFRQQIIDLANNSIEGKEECDHLLMHKITTITPEAMDKAGIEYSIVWNFNFFTLIKIKQIKDQLF